MAATVTMNEIPPEIAQNWDQTGIKMVPCSIWMMELHGTKRVGMVGVNDHSCFLWHLVLGFPSNAPNLQTKDTTHCHPCFEFPPGWHVTHSPKHWSTHIIVPYMEQAWGAHDNDQAALITMDDFKGQATESVNSLLEAHNIQVCLPPPNTTYCLQPMNTAVTKPSKSTSRGS